MAVPLFVRVKKPYALVVSKFCRTKHGLASLWGLKRKRDTLREAFCCLLPLGE